MNAQETGEVFLILLTITHDDLAEPIRVVCNTENVTSRASVFLATYFEVELPADDGESVSSARLSFDNVDRAIVQAIRSIATAPDVLMEIVLASQPDTVEAAFDFVLQAPEWSAQMVSGQLVFEDEINVEMPAHKMSPNLFPGIF